MARRGEGPVVHVLGSLAAGGAERFVVDLLPELARTGHDTALVCLAHQRDPAAQRMLAKLERNDIPLFEGPAGRVRTRSVLAYRNALRSLRPGVVHLHNLNTDAAHFLLHYVLGGAPYLGARTIHSTQLKITPLTRLALRFNPIAGTIFCSDAARDLNSGFIPGIHATIPNGIAFEGPPRDSHSSGEAKRELDLDPEICHFVCVGRFSGESPGRAPKAHDALIEAWRRGGLGRDRALLHLLGDGSLRPELESMAAGDPSIRFHGVVGDVATWLHGADCFVMPSRWEGMPMAAMEAIGTGLPCIFTRIPPIAALDPPLACTSAPSAVESLARALRQ